MIICKHCREEVEEVAGVGLIDSEDRLECPAQRDTYHVAQKEE
jgi:hypothetical protein